MQLQLEPKTKGTLMTQLSRSDPKKNVALTAVSTLTNMSDMFTFYQEYARYLRKHGTTTSVRTNPEITALSNISMASMELFGGNGTDRNEIKWNIVVRSLLTSKFNGITIPENVMVDRNSDPDVFIRTREEMLAHLRK
jgi:hypothetical protein